MNVSVSRMCLDLGMSKSTLSSLKTGKTKTLSAPTLSAIANYLGVSVDYLLGEKEKPTQTGELVNDDAKLTAVLERARNDPHIRMLFSLTADASPEDVEKAIKILQMLKE
jgi:transcriptional regulator with XRE-family HTH domain